MMMFLYFLYIIVLLILFCIDVLFGLLNAFVVFFYVAFRLVFRVNVDFVFLFFSDWLCLFFFIMLLNNLKCFGGVEYGCVCVYVMCLF